MTRHLSNQESLRRYLLGELSPAAQQQLEEQLLSGDESLEAILLAEAELIDDYVAGALPPRAQEQFETYFLLAPERQQKLRFASAFRRYLDAPAAADAAAAAPDLPWWRRAFPAFMRASYQVSGLSLATAALLIVLGGAGLSVMIWRLQQQLAQEQRQRATLAQQATRPAAPPGERGDAPPGPRPYNYFPVALTPGQTRGSAGEMARLEVPATADIVQMRLRLATDDYPSYRAQLRGVESALTLDLDHLGAAAPGGENAVIVYVPAALLTPGDYRLELSGITPAGQLESIAHYSFRALPRRPAPAQP